MRNLVEPPPSLCPLCNGELRLNRVEPNRALIDMDTGVFVCANCSHERAYAVIHNNYSAHAANNNRPAK